MVFDRVQKVFNFAGQQPPQGAKLKNKRQYCCNISSRAYCTFLTENCCLIALRDSDKHLPFGLTYRTENRMAIAITFLA